MRGALVLCAALGAAVLATVPAGAVPTTDIYVTGTVVSRVAGKNASVVRIAWDYKCLGEDRGTYEWTLKLVRMQPQPEQTTTLATGTSERGSKTMQLPPGRYLPKADPYFCETERGQGYEKPEIGGPFIVPDYCSWVVSSARGLVELEQRAAVKRAKVGSVVAPGDALVTPAGGKASLSSTARDGAAVLAAGSRLVLDPKYCPGKKGWKVLLDKGALTATVPANAAKASYVSATRNASVTGSPGARWKVEYLGKKTKVRSMAGVVRVGRKTLKPGQVTTV
jgi:hypothetical protein